MSSHAAKLQVLMREVKLFRSLCFNKDTLTALASPPIIYLAFVALFFFQFFVNCYKLLRLVPLLLMVFTTTDGISFCKRHWLMQKVWTFPSLPHLPLNSFLSLLDTPCLSMASVDIPPLLANWCYKTIIFSANQGVFSVCGLSDSKGRLQARSPGYIMVVLLWSSWSSAQEFGQTQEFTFSIRSFFFLFL